MAFKIEDKKCTLNLSICLVLLVISFHHSSVSW